MSLLYCKGQLILTNDASLFLIGMLVHVPNQRGAIRAGIVLNEQRFFYRISIDPLGSTEIPCGQVVFKN